MGSDDSADDESSPPGEEIVTRVRLDEVAGEVVISRWQGDTLLSEHREPANED